jgi:hypothetical protein
MELDDENRRMLYELGWAVDWDVEEGQPCVLFDLPTGIVRLTLAQAASVSTAVSLAMVCAVERAALDR